MCKSQLFSIMALALLLAGCSQAATTPIPTAEMPSSFDVGQRDGLTYEELMAEDYLPDGPINNGYFLPVGESAPARHAFEGTLMVPARTVQAKALLGRDIPRTFPGFSVAFFTYEDYLVPAERGILECETGTWGVIVDPGKVWSEPGDKGMSRASFPFILVNRDSISPRAQNGVATFLYDEATVSLLRLQVAQETNSYVQFDLWAQLPTVYAPGPVTNQEALVAQFAQELARQVEIRPLAELEAQYDRELTGTFTDGLALEEISATGLVVDGVLYLGPCMTRYGEYPFPRYMRHHVYSVSKSVGNGIAMLRLAQKYGDQVFDLRIADYLEVTAKHEGWDAATFEDALNMAIGVGNGSHDRSPLDINADDQASDKSFWLAQTAQEKLNVAFSSDNHPWGPGEIARYINPHSLVLSAAMDAFLKSQEGPDVHLWDMLNKEVFEPIGVYHLPMLHTIERDGSRGVPIMLLGLYPTVDDTAKIAMLLQDGGRHGDEQLLSSTRLEEALYRRKVAGLPTGKRFMDGDQAYHMSFWGQPYRTQDGLYFQIPYMQGHGGNSVVLAPNGVSSFRFTDADNYDVEPLVRVAEIIRPFPDGWVDPVWLVPNENERYARYGFSLDYPSAMSANENGLWWQGTASEVSGLVQFSYGASSFETIGVLWDTAESAPDLEAFLDEFATVLESLGLEVNDGGVPVSSMKGDHVMVHQHFNVTERGVLYTGVIGTWYCDEANRAYILYYGTIPELTHRLDPLTEFQRYFDSFVCH